MAKNKAKNKAKNNEIFEKLSEIERYMIYDNEMSQLGHRIVYDRTGWSTNVVGCYCPPEKLDENGYQVKL